MVRAGEITWGQGCKGVTQVQFLAPHSHPTPLQEWSWRHTESLELSNAISPGPSTEPSGLVGQISLE